MCYGCVHILQPNDPPVQFWPSPVLCDWGDTGEQQHGARIRLTPSGFMSDLDLTDMVA